MQKLWRLLPKLAVPAIMGLGLAYLATSFLPRPEPTLRPPEELRAHGQGMDEDSPVRAILERNVLRLKSPPFTPPNSPLASPDAPVEAAAAIARPSLPGAAFSPPDPVLAPKGAPGAAGGATPPVSGGPSVQGLVIAPGAALGAPADFEAFRLVGIMAGGQTPVAMLQVEGKALSLHLGEQARGWTLAEVRPGQVLLKRGQVSRWLKLAPQAAP